MSWSPGGSLVPAIGVLRESGTLDAHHAEALAGWRLHHHPAWWPVDDGRAKLLQPCDLGWNVVRLDVDVDPALMGHALNLHDGLVGWGLQHPVVPAAARMLQIERAAERLGPEPCSRVDVRDVAVDKEGAQPGLMHFTTSWSGRPGCGTYRTPSLHHNTVKSGR